MAERILVVAVHPDDAVLGMGGTIARHALVEGAVVTVFCVTAGSSSRYPDQSEVLKLKHEEAQRAAEVLGVREYLHQDLPDKCLDSAVEVNRQVEHVVADLGPSTVYTVHPDANVDHQAAFRSVMVATRPRTGGSVRRVLTYRPMSGVEWTPYFEASFKPTWFTDVTQTLESKILAFECFETETRPWPHPRSSRALRAIAEACGAGVGWAAAEPFTVIRNLHCRRTTTERGDALTDGSTPEDPHHRRGERDALDDLMTRLNRSDPLEEATYAALEAVQLLLRAQTPPDGAVGVRTELTREALAAARASVAATAYSLIKQTDTHRARGTGS